MNPIIGVMSAHDVKNHNYVTRENYLTFLSDAGGTPILLPLGSDVSSIDSLLDICDGILLTGGADVEPARYGEATLPCCGGIENAVKRAMQASGKFIPWRIVTISTDGRILE